MTRAADVVVVGSVNRDYVCEVTSLPGPGQTVLGGEAWVGSGGKGGNQAVAASLLGARTVLVARVGNDDDGRALVADLVGAGVDTRHVLVTGRRTGLAFVLVDATGENSIVVAPGANDLLDAGAAAGLSGLVSSAKVLVTQAEIPAPACEASIRLAARVGCRPVLNLAPYRPVAEDVLALCDPVVVNESEAGALLGREVHGTEAALAAVVELAQRARSVVVTVGAGGAVVGQGGAVEHVATERTEVVDTTGAGDAFTGALAAALSAGSSVLEAARIGVRAGTHAVGRRGAQASFPDAAAVGLAPSQPRR